MNIILLDCLMYEDDALFAKALSALDRDFGQRRKLLAVTDAVTMVHQATLPVFDDVAAALTSAFRRTELSWCAWADAAAEDSGCTALVAVVVHHVGLGGATMFVANCGDCRAVLSRCRSPVQITQDHTAAVQAEAARVLAAGGCIVPARDGSMRVGGVIEVTRSLGDRRLKPLGLSAVPETSL